jgi:hypothetical protein
MRWWYIRLPIGALVALFLLLVVVSPGEGAQPRRAKVRWEHNQNTQCSDLPGNVDREQLGILPICLAVQPGDESTITATVIPDADVVQPRLLFMSANGAGTVVVTAPSPTTLAAGERLDVTIRILRNPNVRVRNISGRLYLADRFSVLAYPLNLRVQILHPTPEELARTPVVVPTNHIQLVMRPPSMVQGLRSARFNIRHLVVTSGTNVTWTNRAASPGEADLKRAVKGTLCDPTKPLSPSRKCEIDPAAVGPCALTVDPEDDQLVTDPEGRILCFLSPELAISDHYSVRLTRPVTRQPLTYYMEDAVNDPDTMVEIVRDRQYHPYVTVK